ncbi:MAG: hypothetical protein BAJATHORv1_120012 [Candidatus Thorarchaeota archaeon]|nr:MAG: hypothetical protein BAJATHORv1_120012 [Candidatus Thorarchaeota archaeon]
MELTVVGHIYRDLRVTKKGVKETIGGAPAYALSGPTLEANGTSIVSCIGADFPESTLSRLTQSGVDTSGLYQMGPKSTTLITTIDEEGKKTRSLQSLAPKITKEFISPHHLESTIIYFSPVYREIDKSCFTAAASTEAILALDLKGILYEEENNEIQIASCKDLDFYLGYINVLLLDEIELSLITEKVTEQDSVDEVLRRGPFIVILLKGEVGSSIYTHHGKEDIPYVIPSRFRDDAGFVQMYMMGFLLEFLRTGGNISSSGHFGAVCASASMESFGPGSLISRYQVERRLRTLY